MAEDFSSSRHLTLVPPPDQDEEAGTEQPTNPYLVNLQGDQPPEIVDFIRATDPYANMLPGVSNIHAARTIGQGLDVGRRRNPLVLAISILLVLTVVVIPAALLLAQHLFH